MRICLWGLAVAHFSGSRLDTEIDLLFLALLAVPCIVADVRELKRTDRWI